MRQLLALVIKKRLQVEKSFNITTVNNLPQQNHSQRTPA